MDYNPLRGAYNYDDQLDNFIAKLNRATEILSSELIVRGLVLAIDRRGGKWPIVKPGANNANNTFSSPFTLRVRLLTNFHNANDGTNPQFLEGDEVFAIPEGSVNMFDLPQAGEVVLLRFNKPFTNDGIYTAYWIARESADYATRDYRHMWKINEADEDKYITHDQSVIWSGERPSIIDNDDDIRPNSNYEPFPEVRRIKDGDVGMVGKSNTMHLHTFNPHEEGDKRGMIVMETESDYIHNKKEMLEFNYDTASEQEIEEFQQIQQEHIKYYLDAYRKTSRNQFLNSKTKLILATKLNVDRHLVHKDTEKDGKGTFGNVQLLYDPHYRDEGPGDTPKDPTNEDRNQCGTEILNEPITKETEYSNTQKDVVKVNSDPRPPISFDEAVAVIFGQADKFVFASPKGKNMNHTVLAEEQARWLQTLLTVVLHMLRTQDIHNDRINRLAKEFLIHQHLVTPAKTLAPLGSPNLENLIKEFLWYDNTTRGTVGNDTEQFEEKGSDSLDMKVKDRITEDRKKVVQLIKDIPLHHSTVFTIN